MDRLLWGVLGDISIVTFSLLTPPQSSWAMAGGVVRFHFLAQTGAFCAQQSGNSVCDIARHD
jgi:hypothetical protein